MPTLNRQPSGSRCAPALQFGGAVCSLRLAGLAAVIALLASACGSNEPTEAVAAIAETNVGALSTAAASSTTIETQPVEASTTVVQPSDTGTLDTGTPDTSTVDTASNTTVVTNPATETSLEAIPSDECRRLTDFADGAGWVVVNDGVMGGRSNGNVEFLDSAMRFTGDLVTAGGGFTSVRLQLVGELDGSDYLSLRVRTDDRVYGLTLEDAAQARGRFVSHGADLTIAGAVDADGWQATELRYDQLSPSVFGVPVDAPPFTPDDATEIGIIIGDGVDGSFALDIDWIDACTSPPNP